ncbi:hypothetical protein HELRODRAFT_164545 [Helobdella robusta]|uniref:Uncharacterized protein n=1 Tax=Helobdella robusta TaxID=6412 RepID=T1EVK2_HELRO|nr:hypothetical protein HELRODRAFT_164545 [Helobdella robusta]ESN94664.1 hypothetical protein HELRODRAFT_164545 [Helobdella robusta]
MAKLLIQDGETPPGTEERVFTRWLVDLLEDTSAKNKNNMNRMNNVNMVNITPNMYSMLRDVRALDCLVSKLSGTDIVNLETFSVTPKQILEIVTKLLFGAIENVNSMPFLRNESVEIIYKKY